jgi:peptidoglycan hydrolase-like protein with peptidoglycan-binding domain
MTDTQWSDVSEWQVPVNDSYPLNFFAFRTNDGNHLDKNCAANLAWAKTRTNTGKIFGFIAYYFYRPGVNNVSIVQQQIGVVHPKMVVMIDVEADGGKVAGNQSVQINAEFAALATWLGSPKRVIGYGNTSDLTNLWPAKPRGARLVVAAYGSNPTYPGKFAHQYANNIDTPPFGPCDRNSADGMDQKALEQMFGFDQPAPPKPVPPTPPKAKAPPFPYPTGHYLGLPSPSTYCHSGHYGGVDSTHVRTWQQQMHDRGWTISVDGDFGLQSETVCRKFQQQKHLTVDGKVGSQTWSTSWTAPVT